VRPHADVRAAATRVPRPGLPGPATASKIEVTLDSLSVFLLFAACLLFLNGRADITRADFSIVNQPGASSYPISGYSWALLYTHQPSQATGQKLVSMLDWLTNDGQAYAAVNGYVPLPSQIRALAHTMLQQITGSNGTHLLG
jgi:hypothetical protein